MAHPIPKSSLCSRLLQVLLLFTAACANPVAPSGGPKDTTPPSVVRSDPPNQSVNFSSDKVVLSFSEFISLKDIAGQLVISPPMSGQPEFSTRGKNLIMHFKEPLHPNTTYNFFFGNAIVDITENNPLAGYQFTFSTGPVLDSLSVGGKLVSAFTNQPVKGAYAMLYDSVYDSVPYKSRPYYLARTGDDGTFKLNNLRNGKYLLFALTDINSDYIYNQPNEEIAFADSLISPEIPETDFLRTDSTARDSLIQKAGGDRTILLRQFSEADSVQKLLKTSLLRENVLSVVFKYPVKDAGFTPLKPELSGRWNITGYNRTRDTLTVWIPSPGSDSLQLIVSDGGAVHDTVELALRPREAITGRSRGKTTETKPVLQVRSTLTTNRISPEQSLLFNFSEPVTHADFSQVQLFADSVALKPEVSFDDTIQTKLRISYKWVEGTSYRLTIADSAFNGLFGHSNDSTGLKFSALTEAETSILKLNCTVPESGSPCIIQLLGDKDKILDQRTIGENTVLEFRYLMPGKYRLKVIYDANGNGRWDTGNYLKKRQPEFVDYYPGSFELRANWTLEEDWTIPLPGN